MDRAPKTLSRTACPHRFRSRQRSGVFSYFGFPSSGFHLAPAYFELLSQNPVEKCEQSKCRRNQYRCVKNKHTNVNPEIMLLCAKEDVRPIATTIIALFDFALCSVLPPCQRVELCLRDNHFFVRPAHGDELTDKGHLELAPHFLFLLLAGMLGEPMRERIQQSEVSVHVLVLDESATHDDLRN